MEEFLFLSGKLIASGETDLKTETHASESEEGGHKAGGEEHHNYGHWMFAFYVIPAILVIFAWVAIAKKQMAEHRTPKGFFARTAEHAYLFVEKLCLNIIGPHGRDHIPFIMTLWSFIFVSNMIGLYSPAAASGDLGINLGMAILTIGYVQWAGIKANGVLGHMKHFAGPKMTGILVLISFLLFFVEIVSELAKVMSLPLRLFANIEGGHMVVGILNNLGQGAGIPWLDMFFPIGAFLLPIKLLTAIIQAFVWAMLACVYIALVTDHGDDHGAEHGDDHALHPVTH